MHMPPDLYEGCNTIPIDRTDFKLLPFKTYISLNDELIIYCISLISYIVGTVNFISYHTVQREALARLIRASLLI